MYTLFIMDTSLTKYPVIQVKTLRFQYLIIFLNSYAHQIWTQPYFHHIIRNYELTLPIFMKKHIFSTSNLGGRKQVV